MEELLVKIEHIGIAIKSLATAIPSYEKLLGTKCYKRETLDSQKVDTAFFKIAESKIELLEGTSEDSVITRFVNKYGEGVHHIAYAVEDIEAALEKAANEGFTVLGDGISEGADNKLVAFLHPKDSHGVLTEFCMDIKP